MHWLRCWSFLCSDRRFSVDYVHELCRGPLLRHVGGSVRKLRSWFVRVSARRVDLHELQGKFVPGGHRRLELRIVPRG